VKGSPAPPAVPSLRSGLVPATSSLRPVVSPSGELAYGRMTLRTRLGVLVATGLNRVSRRLGAGQGTVLGGRAGLAIAPRGLGELARGRVVVLVSGTNGKTTTTALLTTALRAEHAMVVTNSTGSNMPAGHFAALAAGVRTGGPAVLEVDEGYLPQSLSTLAPAVVVLLNLSRDQLDRSNEVRKVAERWRHALAGTAATVVANADDPLVVHGAREAPSVVWVAGGVRWRADAVGCPSCGGGIAYEDGSWSCRCGFRRPLPQFTFADGPLARTAVLADRRRISVELGLPGAFNRRNALLAMAAAEVLGVSPFVALEAMRELREVAGRFALREVCGVPTRMLLAKNPAGWEELLDVVAPSPGPVVVGINARVADGRDPSWLWDVPFERLAGRPVVATGERSLDLSVRLHYAGVDHDRVADPLQAVVLASERGHGEIVQFVGNYTAFHDLLRTGAH
jgi:UDP-N-acetylmuramyl tripeptide synthase